MTRTFARDSFTWLAYLLLAFYAYFLNILGPITPFLKSELGLSYTISSLHFTAFAVGMLAVGFGGHLVIQRLGRRRSLWIGAFGISLSALLLIAGRHPAVTIGASFLMGLVGTLTLAIVPAALSDQHGDARAVAFSEANVISSGLAAAAPLMVGWLANSAGGWRLALGIGALAPILFYLIFRKTVPSTSSSNEIDPSGKQASLPPLFWIYWVAIVLAVSVEFCMIFWSSDYLENLLGLPKADAARAVSLFIAAMILGRMAGSRLVQRLSIPSVVLGSTLLAGAGFLLFWGAGSATPVLAGLFLVGLGIANLYPLILSLAMVAAGNKAAVQASSRATLASGTAILLLPLILGRLADAVGIQPAYGVVAALLVGVLGTVILAGRTLPVVAVRS